jgi:Fibronectin type III domain/F5/8 type C domain
VRRFARPIVKKIEQLLTGLWRWKLDTLVLIGVRRMNEFFRLGALGFFFVGSLLNAGSATTQSAQLKSFSNAVSGWKMGNQHSERDYLQNHEVSKILDGDPQTFFSTTEFAWDTAPRGPYLDLYVTSSEKIDLLRLQARMDSVHGKALGFPRTYSVQYKKGNQDWISVGEFNEQPDVTGIVDIPLPRVEATVLRIKPTKITKDDTRKLYFQLAEVSYKVVGDVILPGAPTRVRAKDSSNSNTVTPTVSGIAVLDKPTHLTGRMVNHRANITWAAPSNSWGRPINKYLIRFRSKDKEEWVYRFSPNSQPRFTTDELEIGPTFIYQVAAVIAADVGSYSENLELRTIPSAPQNPIVTFGAYEMKERVSPVVKVSFSWNPPSDSSVHRITSYSIQMLQSPEPGYWSSDLAEIGYYSSSYQLSLSTNSASFDMDCVDYPVKFRIAAKTADSVGEYIETAMQPIQCSPAVGTPDIPRNVAVMREDSTKTVSPDLNFTWAPPLSDGGSQIIAYVLQQRDSDGRLWWNQWSTINFDNRGRLSAATNYTFNNKSLCRTSFKYRVAAINARGLGTFSAPIEVRAAPCLPSSPQQLMEEYRVLFNNGWRSPNEVLPPSPLGDGAVTVSWGSSADSGGSAIIDYDLQYTEVVNGNDTTWISVPHRYAEPENWVPYRLTVTGLRNKTPYRFRVAWVNGVGKGHYAVTDDTYTPYGVPEKPGELKIIPGSLQADLSWTALANDGGSPITNYLVRYSTNLGNTWSPPTEVSALRTNYLFNALNVGATYIFQVAARNARGIGPFSDSSNPFNPVSGGDMECEINVSLVGTLSCAGNDKSFSPVQARAQCSGCGGNMYGQGTHWFQGQRAVVLPQDAHEIEVMGDTVSSDFNVINLKVGASTLENAVPALVQCAIDDRGRRTGIPSIVSNERYKPFSREVNLQPGSNMFTMTINPIGCLWNSDNWFYFPYNSDYTITLKGRYRAAVCNTNLVNNDPNKIDESKKIPFPLVRR